LFSRLRFCCAFRNAQEKTNHNDTRRVTPSTMSSSATPGVEARTGRENRTLAATDANQPETQSAIPGLSDDVVTAHVLGRIKDPTDLAVLRAVSRAMRDAVAATGHVVEEMTGRVAAGLGYLSTLKHLHRQGRLELSENLLQEAAKTGQLEVVKWLRANGWPWNTTTCSWVEEGGHLEVLQWARANGCEWNEWTCASAAEGGHLEVLQWAHANECPWDERTCGGTAEGGHLEVLQWARATGCPWDEYTCVFARLHMRIELLNWAIANGCPQQ
jgi:hypothetical protein